MGINERTYHLRIGDQTALDDQRGLSSEPRGVPEDEVSELADLNAADEVGHTLREGRIDGVLAEVALDAEVVSVGAAVLGQRAALDAVLVGE